MFSRSFYSYPSFTYLLLQTVVSFEMLRQGSGPDVEALSVFTQCQSRMSDEGLIESYIIPHVFVHSACPSPALSHRLRSYHPRLPHMSI